MRPRDTWRLRLGGRDVSARTTMRWTVQTGRDSIWSQPQPGRGVWDIRCIGADRLNDVTKGTPAVFDVQVGGAADERWLPVWAGAVTDIDRDFRWLRGDPANIVRVQAAGPLTAAARTPIPPGVTWAEMTDGARVFWACFAHGLPIEGLTIGNPLARDTFPPDEALWDAVHVTAAPGQTSTLTRVTPLPPVAAGATVTIRAVFTLTGPALIGLNLGPHRAEQLYLAAGTWLHTAEVTSPTTITAPTLTVDVVPVSDAWVSAAWTDLDGPWTDLPGTWLSGQATAVDLTLRSVEAHLHGWDLGDVMVTARDPATVESVGDHITAVAVAARGVVWETRTGRLTYRSARSRRSITVPRSRSGSGSPWSSAWGPAFRGHRSGPSLPDVDLALPAAVVPTPLTSSLAPVVNSVDVHYGYPGVDGTARPVAAATDPGSVAQHGRLGPATPLDGPLLRRTDAETTAAQIIALHARPVEVLPQVTLPPLGRLDAVLAEQLLTVPPGGSVEIWGAPQQGWLGGSWVGWVEGWTLTGTADGTVTPTLTLSDHRDPAPAPAPMTHPRRSHAYH